MIHRHNQTDALPVIQRQRNNDIPIVLIEANGILPHDCNRGLIVGTRALNDVVTQSGVAEHSLECAVGIANPRSRKK